MINRARRLYYGARLRYNVRSGMGTRKTLSGSARGEQEEPAASKAGEAPEGLPGKSPPDKPPASGLAMHERIGGRLRAMFDKLLEEPVPDRFRQLLEELERKQTKR